MYSTPTKPDITFTTTQWFRKKGFRVVNFRDKSKVFISTFHLGQTLVFALQERPGYTTYIKEASGGALIVFEVKIQGDSAVYFGYCPILLFGIWPRKLSFKREAGLLAYRAEGHGLEMQFKRQLGSTLEKISDI